MLEIKHQVESDVMRKLYHYQQENILCDVLILVRDGSVPAHRVVLAATCPYFTSFEETTTRLCKNHSFPCESMKGINSILKYLYTGELFFDESDFNEILQLCITLKLLPLASSLTDKYEKSDNNAMGSNVNDGNTVVDITPPFGNNVDVSSPVLSGRRQDKSNYQKEVNGDITHKVLVPMTLSINEGLVPMTLSNNEGIVESQEDKLSDMCMYIKSSLGESDSEDCCTHIKSEYDMVNEADERVVTLDSFSQHNDTTNMEKLSSETYEEMDDEKKLKNKSSNSREVSVEEKLNFSHSHEEKRKNQHKFNCAKCLLEFSSSETFITHIMNVQCLDKNTKNIVSQKYYQHDNRNPSKNIHVIASLFCKSKFMSNVDKIPTETRNVIDVPFRKGEMVKKTVNLNPKVEGKINVYRCTVCKEEFLKFENLCKHRKSVHPGSAKERRHCDICGSFQSTWINMMEHKFKTHGMMENLEKHTMLKCTYQDCNYITLREDSFKEHLDRHEKVVCHHCNKSFSNGKVIKLHLLSHEKGITFTCEICGKVVKSKSSLKDHMKLKHSSESREKKFMCHLCTLRFEREPFLQEHILQVHKQVPEGWDKRLLSCNKCDYQTLMGYNMKRHELHHQRKENPESVPRTPCAVCGKLVMTENYNSHYKTAHGEKHFKCTYEGCSYATSEKRRMESHVLCRHKDTKPYSCQFCNYRCKLRGNLTKHLSSQHQYEELTLPKRRKLAFETGENFPSTIVGNRVVDQEKAEQNLTI